MAPTESGPFLGRGHGHGGHGHGAGHGHGHGHGEEGLAGGASLRALGAALVLTTGYMAVEVTVGLWTGGLALVADGAHMLADAAALGLALFASVWARRPPTARSTFGHRRAEVLAAFVNGVALGVTAIGIAVEAVARWGAPHEIRAGAMLVAAAGGLLVNLAVAAVLSRAGQGSVNVRAALAHVAMDAVGSVGAMSAAGLVLAFGWLRADSIVSLGIAGLVAYSGYRVLRETTAILLEAAPANLDVAAVEAAIRAVPGVAALHDLHAWRVSDGLDAVTVHIVLAEGAHGVEACRAVALALRKEFGLEHVTVQPEAPPPDGLVQIRIRRPGER